MSTQVIGKQFFDAYNKDLAPLIKNGNVEPLPEERGLSDYDIKAINFSSDFLEDAAKRGKLRFQPISKDGGDDEHTISSRFVRVAEKLYIISGLEYNPEWAHTLRWLAKNNSMELVPLAQD